MLRLSPTGTKLLYDAGRKWFTIISILTCPVLFIINAPFGRFALNGRSIFLLDGRKSWIVMELVSPLMFILTFWNSPLSAGLATRVTSSSGPSLAQHTLAFAYLVHYSNRAIISPLRTPSRSKSHIIVPFSGVMFNLLNGSLMGTYLSSPAALTYFAQSHLRPAFVIGMFLWAIGFAGNIIHDEILLNLRRKKKDQSKRDVAAKDVNSDPSSSSEHYAIPYGLLYTYISYPNYFCEWVEWFGFALASSPFPFTISTPGHILNALASPSTLLKILGSPPSLFAPTLTPPWIFLLTEIVLMLPRAYKGHQWYKDRFGESYPKERKVVVPFVW